MKESKDLTAEAEIKDIKSIWGCVVDGDSEEYVVEKVIMVEEQGTAILTNTVAKSEKTGRYYEMIYLDPGSESPATLEDANYGGPSVYQVYPYQEIITSYKREKPEVSK